METDKQARRLGHRVLQVYKDQEAETTSIATWMKTTCSKGCAGCCHQLVFVTFPEAVTIAQHLLASPFGLRTIQALMLKVFAQLGPLSTPDLTRDSYFKQKLPCVFLQSDNTCGVYEVRPAACRYHYVVSDPKNCFPDAEDPITASINLKKYEATVWADGERVSKQVGIPFAAAPLPVAVTAALRYVQEGVKFFEDKQVEEIPMMMLSYWAERLAIDSPLMGEAATESP